MADSPKYMVENEMGCGLLGAIFQRGAVKPRKTLAPPPPPIPTNSSKTANNCSNHNSRRPRRASSLYSAFLESCKLSKPMPTHGENPVNNANLRPPIFSHKAQGRRSLSAPRISVASSSSDTNSTPSKNSQVANSEYTRRLKREPSLTSYNLSLTVSGQQKSISNGALYKASTGNAMLLGHLGSLTPHGIGNSLVNTQVKVATDIIRGNILKDYKGRSHQSGNLFHGMMNKMDPEELKSMGNVKYKQGRFEDALALYNKAIALDSSKASYHSNKSAALMSLGRLIEAVFESQEAIRIEPAYHNAHYRLARLYLRLGEAYKALHHFKCSGTKADTNDIDQAQALGTLLKRCMEAHKLRDWNRLLKDCQNALSSGADSALQVYSMQAQALLNLHSHQKAYSIIEEGPNFDIELCVRFFGLASAASFLIIRAQIYMAAGRFEDAVAAAQCAAQFDLSNEVNTVAKRVKSVASARANGNQLFKASRFQEACAVYSEGLKQEPHNAVLLCNRAACQSKLSQLENAVEDCTEALKLQPSYNKARLRRADCQDKLGRWEAAIQDYELLIHDMPGDEEIGRALLRAKVQLQKQCSVKAKDMKFACKLICISNKQHFRQFVNAPGMSVVLFCNRTRQNQVLQLMERVCKGFPTVYFLKVEIEDHHHLVKAEDVNSVPAFRIYKNGSKIAEIPGDDSELLESSVKLHSN